MIVTPRIYTSRSLVYAIYTYRRMRPKKPRKGVVKSGHGAAHAGTLSPWAVGLTAPAASSKPPARRFCFSFSSIRSSTWKILRNSGHSIVPLPEEGRRG